MKKITAGLILILFSLIACEQDATNKTDEEGLVCGIRVKVVHSFCAFIFLEIQDEAYFHLGDANWKFEDGRTTKPVFMVTNICDFGPELYQNNLLNTEFEIKQVTTYEDECAVCMGGYGGDLPDKSLIVRLCNAVEE